MVCAALREVRIRPQRALAGLVPVFNEAPVLLPAGIVALAVVKPF
jgi:uncharacterized membrane protein